jgi:hypothetical protein
MAAGITKNTTAGLAVEGRRFANKVRIMVEARTGSVNACAPGQSRYFILKLQLATLQFTQFEIVHGWMLKRLSQFIFKHPMPLFEVCKLRRCSHVSNLLGQIAA